LSVMHENLDRREKIKGSSDRSFGLVIAVGFAFVALLPLWHPPHQPRWWALAVAVMFALFAWFWPRHLAVLNRLWLRFGLVLSAILSPVVLGLLFYSTLLPIGLIMRISGKDPLRMRPDRDSNSYWIKRDLAGVSQNSMRHQF
jgi:hypothetical protein